MTTTNELSTAYIFDHARIRYGTADIAQHQPTPGTQNVDQKPKVETEVEIHFERKELAMRFQRLPPHFRP
jgi:hypothetical protein